MAQPDTTSPVVAAHGEPDAPKPGVALCLSGGGYRAMLFHVGALWRLNELGALRNLDRISSVSGGSITSGVLALRWNALGFDASGTATRFQEQVVDPIRRFARQTVDVWSVVVGVLPFTSINARVIAAYDKHLYNGATLQDLPDNPRFVINATNIQSGALWRFEKPYMRDYLVGEVKDPTISLAAAVAASSAFPPILSPAQIDVPRETYSPRDEKNPEPLYEDAYMLKPVLSDGGVYDNLGLETAWKRYDTILVSDAGLKIAPDPKPAFNWASHSKRVLDVIDNQVRSLRKRQLIAAYQANQRKGTYWGIRSHPQDYEIEPALPAPLDRIMELATISTRLAPMPIDREERLINWGYLICDTAMRRWVNPNPAKPAAFPYKTQGV
jgi:NTE family protein